MSAERAGPVLVLGGTGKTGRRIAARLTERGLPVRLGSRSGSPAFHWDDPAGWPALLSGVDAAYIAYAPDLAVPGAVEDVRRFAEIAAAQGVRRLVLLSGRGEPEAEEAESAVAAVATAGGADWTVLRASWFAQNFSESFLLDGVLAGEIALPAGEIPEPFVDADDIADVAVAALTGSGHAGRIYELTGPRALTFGAAVAEIGRASGRDLRYGTMPAAEFGEMLRGFQVPEAEVQLILYLFGTVLDGRNAAPADGVQQALGRAPRDFADYARAAAAAGAWSVPAVTAAGGAA
ncbi:NmrA family transcriptional regulator [Marinibaculum pumilum]|uniref:NmrA family transcriptional regulator n=1 Tax=Marinibaculum pumilum TaxID=1766165 RepID=A0ABV7KVW9_9PROT